MRDAHDPSNIYDEWQAAEGAQNRAFLALKTSAHAASVELVSADIRADATALEEPRTRSRSIARTREHSTDSRVRHALCL